MRDSPLDLPPRFIGAEGTLAMIAMLIMHIAWFFIGPSGISKRALHASAKRSQIIGSRPLRAKEASVRPSRACFPKIDGSLRAHALSFLHQGPIASKYPVIDHEVSVPSSKTYTGVAEADWRLDSVWCCLVRCHCGVCTLPIADRV